jgi:hypothetical protein
MANTIPLAFAIGRDCSGPMQRVRHKGGEPSARPKSALNRSVTEVTEPWPVPAYPSTRREGSMRKLAFLAIVALIGANIMAWPRATEPMPVVAMSPYDLSPNANLQHFMAMADLFR